MTRRAPDHRRPDRPGLLSGSPRRVVVAVALAMALAGLLLLLLVTVQAPRTGRYDDGARAVRLSHLAMVDQQTGLRAFLATGQPRFLDPYRRGRDALDRHDAAARRGLGDDARLRRLLQRHETSQRAWVDGWAIEASGGLTEAETLSRSLARDDRLFEAYRRSQAELERAADRLSARAQDLQVRLLGLGLVLELLALVVGALAVRPRSRDVPAARSPDVVETPVTPRPPSPPPSDDARVDGSVPVVDPAVLTALTARLGPRAEEFAVRLLATWHGECTRMLAGLDVAAAEGDPAAASRCAHALKSGSAVLGARRLAAFCEDFERRLRAGSTVDLPDAAAGARREVAAAQAAFAERVVTSTPAAPAAAAVTGAGAGGPAVVAPATSPAAALSD